MWKTTGIGRFLTYCRHLGDRAFTPDALEWRQTHRSHMLCFAVIRAIHRRPVRDIDSLRQNLNDLLNGSLPLLPTIIRSAALDNINEIPEALEECLKRGWVRYTFTYPLA
jgi:hypothetical protein